MGITVLPPDVNESEIEFTVVYTPDDAQDVARLRHKPVCYNGEVHDPMGPKIRFGLGAIKGCGTAAVEAGTGVVAGAVDPRGSPGVVPGALAACLVGVACWLAIDGAADRVVGTGCERPCAGPRPCCGGWRCLR